MRSRRFSLCLFAVLALIAVLAGSIAPANADPVSFNRALQAFIQLRADFEKNLQSLDSNGTTPGGLKAWANGVDTSASNFEYSVSALSGELIYAGRHYAGSVPCGGLDWQLNGPYGSSFGFERLATPVAGEVSSWEAAIAELDKRQNDLNHAILAGRQYDKHFSNNEWSTAMTAALKTAHNRYPALVDLSKSTAGQAKALTTALASPSCKTAAQPAHVATPTPTPAPKPATASKSGCVGFNGYWANQVFANPLIIRGSTATQERATSTWTFTGTVAGKMMRGTYTSTRGDKGTFTFTMAYTDLDYIDVVLVNSYGSNTGLLTYHCTRGL